MNEDAIFKAIAHPARREILALLAGANRSVKELTATFAMSQPAVSQHMRELRDAKLVSLPPTDMFWGDRYAWVRDPFGHTWAFMHDSGIPDIRSGRRAHARRIRN